MTRLDPARSLIVVIDLQEKLVPAIADNEAIIDRAKILIAAAERIAAPIVVTEHVPDKIGGTLEALLPFPDGTVVVSKHHFSAADAPGFLEAVEKTGRDQVVILGTEAHVCVLQTALGVAATGRETYVVTDASGSRRHADRDAGYQRLALSGVVPVTSEMVVFEWARSGADPAFRDLHKLIK